MTFFSRTFTGLTFAAVLALGACVPNEDFRARAETYLRSNIETLSPRSAPDGDFSVRSVTWIDADTARVVYGTSTIELVGDIDLREEDGEIVSSNIRIVLDDDENEDENDDEGMQDDEDENNDDDMDQDDEDDEESSPGSSMSSSSPTATGGVNISVDGSASVSY